MRKVIVVLPCVLCLCSCVNDRQIDDENVFEHIRVNRGSTIYGNAFFKSATNKPLGKCLDDISFCTHKQLAVGEQIEAQYYEVHLMGTSMYVTHPMDKLFTAAAMVAAQENFNFFTPVQYTSAESVSERPESYTDCYSLGYSVSCTTSNYKKYTVWKGYSIHFLAYNNYEDIKNGVLTYDASENKAYPFHPLYTTKEDQEKLAIFLSDSSLHYYTDAWKAKYNALDVLKGEKVEIKQFDFQDKYLTTYTSVEDKYKQ